MGPTDRIAALDDYHRREVISCVRCPLSEGRTQVVVGAGNPDADVLFVGEAPGYHEDQQGVPFVGQAGKLLGRLLEGIGVSRDEVFIANVLKCRPPENRNPRPDEIAACEPHLFRQIQIIRPRVVCTLGNIATRLLSGRPEGITRVHGHELPLTIAGTSLLLYPLFHPAAALYARATLATLEADFARIPELVAREAGSDARPEPEAATPPPPSQAPRQAETAPVPHTAEGGGGRREVGDSGPQLGLF